MNDTAKSYSLLHLYQPPLADRDLFETALTRAVAKIETLVPRFGLRNPRISAPGTTSYTFCTADEWVASFWPGQMWLAHSLTGKPELKNSARMRREYFQRVLETPDWHDHDLGFLFTLSCIADWKLTGNETARAMALRAADFLAARWRQPLPFVMCWNPMPRDSDKFAAQKVGALNVDSMQGMALLYWATEQTGQESYARIADMHLETCCKYLVREDFSSFHCYDFDPRTGAPLYGFTHQGASDESCWSRGQSWVIHGLAVSYLKTGRTLYRDTAAKCADYVEAHLPDNGVPPWDYDLPKGAKAWPDSSAGAVTAAGLFALAQGFDNAPEAARYAALGERMLRGLVETCDLTQDPTADGLLKHGAAFIELGLMDQMLPYGDYYYVEALMRALGHTEFFW